MNRLFFGLIILNGTALLAADIGDKAKLRGILDAPASAGASVSTLTKVFGKPISKKEEGVEGGSTVTTLKFEGAEAKIIFTPNFGNKRILARLKIERDYKSLKIPFKIGEPTETAVQLLGQPQQTRKKAIEYVYQLPESGPGGDRLVLWVKDGLIQAIEWAPYIE